MKKIASPVINDKVSIKNQLRTAYSIIMVFSVCLTLGICLGLLYSLSSTSYKTAKNKIDSQTDESVVAVSFEVTYTVNQQLKTVSDNICLTSVLFSSILIKYSNMSSVDGGTLLNPQLIFRDYDFVPDCTYPKCPPDFRSFHKSRLPSRFEHGSVTRPSIYLYSGKYQQAVRNDSFWDQVVNQSPEINNTVNGLVYQDNDLRINYKNQLNMSTMYYMTAQIENYDTGITNVVHRTFPGILLDESIVGNPTQNEWFQKAPTNAVYFHGPYVEPMTGELVVSMSSRKSVYYPAHSFNNQHINFVTTGIVSLKRIATALCRIPYTDSGFGALMRYDTNEMLVWKDNRVSVYDSLNKAFYTLDHFDSVLATRINELNADEKTKQKTLDYTSETGVEWIVSYVPFFTSQEYSSDKSYRALILLVFSKVDDAKSPLIHLADRIQYSDRLVVTWATSIVAVTVLVVILLVFFTIQYITSPLPKMMAIAEEIIRRSTADDAHKDYNAVVMNPLFALNRQDEIGLLISDYYQLLTVLQARSFQNRDSNSLYPYNPFHVIDDDACRSPTASAYEPESIEQSWNWLVDRLYFKLTAEQKQAMAELADRSESPSKVKPQKSAKLPFRAGGTRVAVDIGFSPIPESDEPLSVKVALDLEGGRSDMVSSSQLIITDINEHSSHTKTSVASPVQPNRVVSTRHSLKTQLNSLFVILLVGLLTTMIVTVVLIRHQGNTWTRIAEVNIRDKIVHNLQAIVDNKATYVEAYFNSITIDISTSTHFYGDIVQETTVRPGWYNKSDLFLPTYASDGHDPYCLPPGISKNGNVSSYYVTSAARCEKTPDNCKASYESYNTRKLSLADLKFRSLFRTGSLLSNTQHAIESDGTTRYLPASRSQNLSYPVICYHQDTTEPHCAATFVNSSCNPLWVNPAGAGIKKFPYYDARCRGWYQDSVKYGSKGNVYYQTPKVSEAGAYVLTAGIAVHGGSSPGSPIVGVVTANILMTTLSKSIARLFYLTEGYCYLVKADNTSTLVVHQNANSKCKFVHCAEGFSADEYNDFYQNTLLPLQTNAKNVSTVYYKKGRQWQLVYSRAVSVEIDYVVIATIPVDVILDTSKDIQSSINNTVVGMIIAFVFAIVFLVVFSALYAYELVKSIVNPINELRKVFELLKLNQDLSGQVPDTASSLDMHILLEAFSKLMVALRFSSESYTQGNQKRTREVYSDALSLYTGNNDKRGIGISLANLAASELARQRYDTAESLFKKAIENAEDILKDRMESREEVLKMERMLSDRKTSLASVYLEEMRMEEAMEVLTPAMDIDTKKGYLIGYAAKQALIGNYHIQKQDFEAAEHIFEELINFTNTCDSDITTPGGSMRINREEKMCAEQIALYRMASLYIAQQSGERLVETTLIKSLVKHSVMHVETTTKALIALKGLFATQQRRRELQEINFLAAEYNLNVSRDTTLGAFARNITGSEQLPKRVMFCLDYSAAIAGMKFTTVMDNVNTIFELHVNDQDSMSILYFNNKVRFGLPITPKKDNELMILDQMEKICAPKGASTLFDAIAVGLYALSLAPTAQDWLLVVTNSDDSASKINLQVVLEKVMQSKAALIIIGIGDDIQTAALELLASSTKRGVYLQANTDKKSINEAFEHAIHIIDEATTIATPTAAVTSSETKTEIE